MAYAAPRAREQRKADTLAKLTAPAADAWVATAGADAGERASCHMVPLSLAWVDERVVLATEADSVTGRNIAGQGRARLGLGPTRDVIMIDAELERVYGLDESPPTWPGGLRRKRTGTRASRVGRCGSWCYDRCESRRGGKSTSSPGGP